MVISGYDSSSSAVQQRLTVWTSSSFGGIGGIYACKITVPAAYIDFEGIGGIFNTCGSIGCGGSRLD